AGAPQPHAAHQPPQRAFGNPDAFPVGLDPHLADPIHPLVLVVDPADLWLQLLVAKTAGRPPLWLPLTPFRFVVSGRGDLDDIADRLDPELSSVLVDKGDHRLGWRSSSAWANYADALRRLSFARRSSVTSRRRSFNSAS